MTEKDTTAALQILALRFNTGENVSQPMNDLIRTFVNRNIWLPGGYSLEAKNINVEWEVEDDQTVIGFKLEIMNSDEDWVEIDTSELFSMIERDVSESQQDNSDMRFTEKMLNINR